MAVPALAHTTSYADYLHIELDSGEKHEYVNGEAWAMAGGTVGHAAVAGRLFGLLFGALRGRPCQPFHSDLKILVPETGLATYPDLSVVCGAPERAATDVNAVTNPTVVVEVLSSSTEAWDRGGKFAHYRALASLQEYVLVSVQPQRVEVYRRGEGGEWILRVVEGDGRLRLASVDVEIFLAEVYEGVAELDAGSTRAP